MGEAFATSVASNLVSQLGECLIAPIGRQFGYVLRYKSYVKDLENGVKELETARERVERSVDEAVYNGKSIHKYVKTWLKSVKEETDKADNLLKSGESAKDACFRGWLPNPVVRHPIGRKVKKMTQVIQGLHDESKNSIFQKVYYENPPIGIVTATASAARSVSRKEDVLESRASITEDVIKAIADDKVCVIGVYGPGGVGKSKLMEDVERRVKEEQLFDVVATTNVSCNPDLKRIQGEIAYALGLKLENEETVRGRADLLCNRLKKDSEKKILIILDNLWTKLDLKEVGIPCGYDNKVRGCKLLLTSRYRDVLYTEMGSDQEFQLRELKNREARILFERTVGDKVNDPQFKSLVDRVVKNCGGLPLLILSVAKRLKSGDLPEWRNALTNREGSSVKSLVEQNYNDLKDERIKSLFLVCALDSGRPDIRDTLIYCMGLGLFKTISETIEDARDWLIMDLRRLLDSSLLLGSDDLEHLFMHDLFIDVGISMHDKFVDTEWNALVGRKDFGFKEWSKHDLKKCTAMAFNFVGIDELPEKLDCPNMRILLLLEQNRFLKMPESFFESMEKLQVLDLTGLSFTSLPSSMEFLENLKSLCLDRCHLEDVTVLGKLKGLQFLGFGKSTIARLPKEIGELTELRFLEFSGCTGLKVIEPGVLESLVNLEELYMQNSFDQWEAEDETLRSNASLAELKNMKKLSTLYIDIPHPANLSRDLPFGKLNKYNIQIGGNEHWWGANKESRTLKLKLDSENLLHEMWLQECLGRTQDLRLDGLQEGRDNIHDLCTEGFQELKHLHVENNLSCQYVVDSTQCPAFTRLESLVLKNLNNLEKICRDCLTSESFSKLKIVKVKNCGEIKHLFPSSMTRIFFQLEEIEITKCHLIQQIVPDAKANEYKDEIDYDANVKSWKLRRLTLQNLPEMTSFCKTQDHSVVFLDGQQVSLPWLESLTLYELPKLKEIWNSQFPSDVSNLKFLKVKDCAFLLSIFPSNLVTKLQNLEAIVVERCQLIRKVFDLEGLIASGDVEILSRLTTLTLSDLPWLGHIWNKNPRVALCFRNLRALKVQNCDNLRFIFSSSTAKALQKIKEIKIVSCKLLEGIIAEEDQVGTSVSDHFFSQLTNLRLVELPELRSFYRKSHTSTWPLLKQLHVRHCGKMRSLSFACEIQSCQGTTTGEDPPALFSFEKVIPQLKGLTLRREDVAMLQHHAFVNLRSLSLSCYHDENVAFPSNFLLHRFPNLEDLAVSCNSFDEIFPEDAFGHGGASLKALGNLKLLYLNKLCNLRRVWKDGSLMAEILKQIEFLWVDKCPSLSIVFPSPTSFQRLTQLQVENCAGLVHMGTCSAVTSLVHLTWLTLRNCGAMEDVVTDDGNGAEEISFPKLQWLMLDGLPSLESFSPVNCAFKFPSLARIIVMRCPKMNIFCKGALRTPNLDEVLLSEEDDEGHWEGDLNTTIQTLST